MNKTVKSNHLAAMRTQGNCLAQFAAQNFINCQSRHNTGDFSAQNAV